MLTFIRVFRIFVLFFFDFITIVVIGPDIESMLVLRAQSLGAPIEHKGANLNPYPNPNPNPYPNRNPNPNPNTNLNPNPYPYPYKKVLWTMSDEKWWFGLVSRTFAKMCPALGIEKEVFSVHHKKRISKVMAHATVGYFFNGNPENGGEGVLLHIQRCQTFKVAQRGYRGKGGRVIKKGDCILTDCNVTGTNTGTTDKPKFALRPL